MSREELSHETVVGQLRSLGVRAGGVLVVHTAFSRVRPIDGGPLGLIAALRAALGPTGTLVMPSMCDDDDHVFDAATSACRSLGIVADIFWRLPGVLRSDSPHAFAALGPLAAAITAPHPVEIPHGEASPPARAAALGGQVLLLGVGHDCDTTVHVAENLAGVRYRLATHATVLREGRPVRLDYGEVDHCCLGFRQLDGWLETAGRQVRGVVGHAEARLARGADVIAAAVERLRQDETVFLHPRGTDPDCDTARASIPVTSSGGTRS